MTVADTAGLVALLDANHTHHAQAAHALKEGPVVVTWGSLSEVATVIRRLAKENGLDGNLAARQALAAITGLKGFRDAAQLPLPDVLKLHHQEPSLSFVDAWNLHLALATKEPLLTFDRALKSAARRHRAFAI
ncbi:MAG: PIN domain-containing protein [Thermoplasmatota archaeon]